MAANLALVANFVDITKPTLSIVSPTLNQQWSNATFTASGKAADNVAVATVYYSLNGGLWTNATTANNWTNWSASLPLTPGTNSLQAYALDASGNASATNTVQFKYVANAPATVASSAAIVIPAPAIVETHNCRARRFVAGKLCVGAVCVEGFRNNQCTICCPSFDRSGELGFRPDQHSSVHVYGCQRQPVQPAVLPHRLR